MRIAPFTQEYLNALVQAYQSVFATAPWGEWKHCQICKQQWSIEQENELQVRNFICCGQTVDDFWPATQVKFDIRHELSQPNSSCWLAIDQGKVIGFTWGYEVFPDRVDQKLGISVQKQLLERFPGYRFAYQDEVGVVTEYRRQGIARQLVKARAKDFKQAGLEIGIVRTLGDPTPSHTYTWYLHEGYQVIANYPTDNRVIMAKPL